MPPVTLDVAPLTRSHLLSAHGSRRALITRASIWYTHRRFKIAAGHWRCLAATLCDAFSTFCNPRTRFDAPSHRLYPGMLPVIAHLFEKRLVTSTYFAGLSYRT